LTTPILSRVPFIFSRGTERAGLRNAGTEPKEDIENDTATTRHPRLETTGREPRDVSLLTGDPLLLVGNHASASMSDALKQQLKKQGLVTLTILFDDAQTCEDFADFGEVVLLRDVTQ